MPHKNFPILLFPATAILMNGFLSPPNTIRTTLSAAAHPVVQHPRYCDSQTRSCGTDFISSRLASFGRLQLHNERSYFHYCVALSGILQSFGGKGRVFFFLHNLSSRHEQENHEPSSCFCRIMAACCSFVRWNSVPDCYGHRYEIREFWKIFR